MTQATSVRSSLREIAGPLSKCLSSHFHLHRCQSFKLRRRFILGARHSKIKTGVRMASLVDVPITFGLVARTIGILLLFAVLRFFYRLYQVRSLVRKAAKENGVVSPFSSRSVYASLRGAHSEILAPFIPPWASASRSSAYGEVSARHKWPICSAPAGQRVPGNLQLRTCLR